MNFATLTTVVLLCPAMAGAGVNCTRMPEDLAAMRVADQSLRERQVQVGYSDERLDTQLEVVDRDNTRRVKQYFAACGWPHSKTYGQTASDDAWLLVQHADRDRAFQRKAIVLLEKAVKTDGARGGHLAYLADRIAVADGKPQPYGTQFKLEGCNLVLFPIQSRTAVNERRKAILGMPTLEEYEREAAAHLLPPDCLSGP